MALGTWSRIWLTSEGLTVRFFGLRKATVRFDELSTATFGIVLPSISFALRLTDRGGRKAVIHANWWKDESAVMEPVCRALVEYDVAMDRMTAKIVAQVLRVKRPRARIVHHALLRKDRTW